MEEPRALLHRVADDAADWLDGLAERPVRPAVGPAGTRVFDVDRSVEALVRAAREQARVAV